MQIKKIIFASCLLFSTIVISAQFSKGERMIGATIGAVFYNEANTEYAYPGGQFGFTRTERTYGFNLNPNYGWFVSDNTVIGTTFLFSYEYFKTFSTYEQTGNTSKDDVTKLFNIGVGGFARNYFKTSGSLHPFAQVGFNFGINTAKNDGFYYDLDSTYNIYHGKSSGGFFANAGLAAGLTKMLNKNIGLEFSLAYNFSYRKSDYKTTYLVDHLPYGTPPDETRYDRPAVKYTNHGVVLGIGFQLFLDKR